MDEMGRRAVLVTGCSSGIGLACAQELQGAGLRVVASARAPQNSPALASWADEHPDVVLQALDVTDEASVRAAVEATTARLGAIDVLVNNAGVGYNATVEDAAIDRVGKLMDTNVLGPWRCAQAVLPAMRTQGHGVIVNMSSVMSRVPMPGQSAYVASKAALVAMSRCLAAETARDGIQVVVVEPSVVSSRIFEKNLDVPAGSSYGWVYDQLFDFYGRALGAAPPAAVVGEAVVSAVTGPTTRDQWFCGWHGEEIGQRADAVGAEEWTRLGTATDLAGFRTVVEELLGVPRSA